ncbi:MAG: hypothetical protein GY765_40010 [bacterium]|nr:hypothetical protein [bacterium]
MNFENYELNTKIDKTSKMLEGVSKHMDSLSPAGIKKEYIASVEELMAKISRYQSTTDVQATVAKLRRMEKRLADQYVYFRKIIKLIIPVNQWKQFGMEESTAFAA